MKSRVGQCIAIMLLLVSISSSSQTLSNSGIWQDYGAPLNPKTYPSIKGRLVNINWADFETAPDVWNWSIFDKDITDHIADSMPIIFMVYTRTSVPDWIFSNGVPKVTETNDLGVVTGYSPYYLDSEYNVYFKRMITKVRQHLKTFTPFVRNQIIGVQGCFGSTGDYICYKGNVPAQYQITDDQFDSLFQVYSLYYYNEYKNTTPKITLLSNPSNTNSASAFWVINNCPNGWIKCGNIGKGFQLNMESDKNAWLYDILNKPWNGNYIKSRSEIWGDQLDAGWWAKNKYKSMFALMNYCIYWGLDWPNQTTSLISDPKNDSAYKYFNKYAGQKIPGLAKNAVCALKDVLDASDEVRFPASVYGTVDIANTTRYKTICNSFAAYGAKLEDVSTVIGPEGNCLNASGTNDVGWHLLPGNYERYLRQIDANLTSAGYWNVDPAHNDVMYGRFARGFDLAKGKDALYFNVEDAFFRNVPLNSNYPVTIEVIYYDNGTGSWQLYYNAQNTANKVAAKITCTNTLTWKKASFTLNDAYFGNTGTRGSDFYIKNAGSSNVVFSVVELSRPQQTADGFIASSLQAFDTTCVNSSVTAKSFVLNGSALNGNAITIGPLNGFTFSTAVDSTFNDSIIYTNYGSGLNATIYVKVKTAGIGYFSGNIPISGAGAITVYVPAKGVIVNTSPALDPVVTTVSCYNKKDGLINLRETGGTGPFSYSWSSSIQRFWNATTDTISGLQPADYTVLINSAYSCVISKTYTIIQPDMLVTSVSLDSAIRCKNGNTTITISASGGTLPYYGAGTFIADSGYDTYTVTDARGCSDLHGLWVSNGTITPPVTPGISGPANVSKHENGVIFSVKFPNSNYKYTWTVPGDATITAGQNSSSINVKWGNTGGNVTVKAQNECGTSSIVTKSVGISGFFNTSESSVQISESDSKQLTVMPNPAKEMAIVQFTAASQFDYTVQVSDASGRILQTQKGRSVAGSNSIRLNVQNLTQGQYFVTLISKTGEKQTARLVKI